MADLIQELRPKARKDYICEASVWINELGDLRDYTFTFSEWRAVINARDNNFDIKKGDIYIRQCISDGGELRTFKAIPEIHENEIEIKVN